MCYLLLQAFCVGTKTSPEVAGVFFWSLLVFCFFFWVPYQDKLFIEAPVLEME